MRSVTKKNRIVKKDVVAINVLAMVIVGIAAFISLVPFYVIIVSSFRSEASIISCRSAEERVMGFSEITFLPASIA